MTRTAQTFHPANDTDVDRLTEAIALAETSLNLARLSTNDPAPSLRSIVHRALWDLANTPPLEGND